MLLDYYGDLLTDKQKEYFDLHYNQDLTLAEIGEMNGISRQGVWEIVRRAEAAMRAIDAISEWSPSTTRGARPCAAYARC